MSTSKSASFSNSPALKQNDRLQNNGVRDGTEPHGCKREIVFSGRFPIARCTVLPAEAKPSSLGAIDSEHALGEDSGDPPLTYRRPIKQSGSAEQATLSHYCTLCFPRTMTAVNRETGSFDIHQSLKLPSTY